MEQHLIQHDKALEFILGGNALFTMVSKQTGKRYTFKVIETREDKNLLRVKILTGPDNNTNYKQFGTIRIQMGQAIFEPFGYFIHHEYCKAFEHIFMNLCLGLEMPNLEIYHSGRCCRCGRLLTVPDSIINGIGPECAFQISKLQNSLL